MLSKVILRTISTSSSKIVMKNFKLAVLGPKVSPYYKFLDQTKEYCNYTIFNDTDFKSQEHDFDSAFYCEFNKQKLQSFIKSQPKLQWIHCHFAGVDHVLIPELVNSNITLTNSKGAYNKSLVEHVMLSMLYFGKRIPEINELRKIKKWEQLVVNYASHKNVMIIGFGNIGASVSSALRNNFDCNVLGVCQSPEKKSLTDIKRVDKLIKVSEMYDHLPSQDFFISILPGTSKTKGMIDKKVFSKMNKNSVFINIGRGSCVNEKDLIETLKNKAIYGAALDVFEVEPLPSNSPLYDMSNALLTFHCTDNTADMQERAFKIYLKEIERFSKGLKLRNVINKSEGY